ncbi:MAG TPA: sn-glycerol-3-phosphate ABC transporter ATP-binding protein UgpC [Ktedonobacterales bacterium]|nr:sn-glycerol-3-phosphate ABC transporter ATP-binding protein UgpC [Ktedonobacterales bacterium]
MADVRFEHVTKRYGQQAPVIMDLNLSVADHEFLVLVGPSGCGKSTALRMIAGLEEISEGDLYIGDRRVNDVAPKDRDIAMVFQNYALYPHMSVRDNMAFSLKLRHLPAAEVEARASKAAEMLGLGPYLSRKPRELSGGQRQRVALGRALVREPRVFLLDEPLSNLDAKLRVQTRAEIARLHLATRTTFVYVTHDQVEAMTMGDRIAVLNAGVIQQLGAPPQLYDTPANLFVAGFIGSPTMNFFNARLVRGGEGGAAASVVFSASGDAARSAPTVPLGGVLAQQLAGHAQAGEGRPVVVGIRPEHLGLAPADTPGTLAGTVDVVEHLGNEQLVYVKAPGAILPEAAAKPLEAAPHDLESTGTPSVVVRIGAGTRVSPGDRVVLAFEADHLHVFDPATTNRLT